MERGGHGGPRSGPTWPGLFSGDSGGLSFSRDQPGAQGFFRNSGFQTGRIYLFLSEASVFQSNYMPRPLGRLILLSIRSVLL